MHSTALPPLAQFDSNGQANNVTRGHLLRVGTATHSMSFGECGPRASCAAALMGGMHVPAGTPSGTACPTRTHPAFSCPSPADSRLVWLNVVANTTSSMTLQLPSNPSVLPPGWYMLVLVADNGVPSTTKFVQVNPSK